MLDTIKNYLRVLKEINFKDASKSIPLCDVLLFCHDVDRGVSLGNKAYSPLIDSIRDQLEEAGYSCVSIAHPWSKIVSYKGYGDPIAINRSYFLSRIINKIFLRFEFNSDRGLYEKIIKKANPKVIITIGCNDDLCEAARNMKVFHAELLHGIGYTPLPWGWDKKKKKHLPQGILSLDPVSTNTFSELKKHNVLIKEIPHPFLSRFQGSNLDKLPDEWLPDKIPSKYKKEILISLQWGYAPSIDEFVFFKGFLTNGLFYEELQEVITQTYDTVLWRFRFHPVQYRQPEKYKKLFDFIEEFVQKNENCDWRESTRLPLPALLMNCSGHITMSSMSNYEAAYMGVPTLALCPSLRKGGIYEDFFNDLVVQGYLDKKTVSVDYILEWVSSAQGKPPLLSNLSEEDWPDLMQWLRLK